MAKSDLKILVSGASVAGLSVAYWLAHHGFKVTVVERAPHLRPGGQAIDVRGAAALEVADRMGVLLKLRERSTKLTGMSMVDIKGQEVFRTTEQTLTGGKIDSPNVEILRDELVDVLFDAVGEGAEYLSNDTITRLDQDADGVDVTFANSPQRRFNLVIGADGVRSNVRRLVFGPDEKFLHYLGAYISLFSIPNFMGLDHWQVFCQDGNVMGGILTMDKDQPSRTYLGFMAHEPRDYDYRDVSAQKQLIADEVGDRGWEFGRLLDYMQTSPDFYFDSINQVRMDYWSIGRVALLGDAGYAVSLSTGQGTSVAMIAAYVLAGELAAHPDEPSLGLERYERELRDYVDRNQALAGDNNLPEPASASQPVGPDNPIDPASVPDYGARAVPFELKYYG